MNKPCLAGCLLSILLSPGALNTAFAAGPPRPTDTEQSFAHAVVVLTNHERERLGLAPLKIQPDLRTSTKWLAQDMATQNYISHTDRLGREIDPRIPDLGYQNYLTIGENIAGGQTTPQEVVQAWLHSPGHRSNLLNPNFSEIGVAYAYRPTSTYRHYWAQDFGSRANIYPVVINDEEAKTSEPTVHLYVYGQGWATQMRLSNNGTDWTDWQPYQSRLDWQLAPGYGLRTVYVEVKAHAIVRQAQDSIEVSAPVDASVPTHRSPLASRFP